MAATGSVSIVATDAVTPERWIMPFQKLMSATDHYGLFHEEDVIRLPFSVLTYGTASLYVGALDAAVEHDAGAAGDRVRPEQSAPQGAVDHAGAVGERLRDGTDHAPGA